MMTTKGISKLNRGSLPELGDFRDPVYSAGDRLN